MDLKKTLNVITELVNIGMGDAANSLSELLDSPITITIPLINIIQSNEIDNFFKKNYEESSFIISIDFTGTIEGKSLLTYSKECAQSLIRLVLDDQSQLNELSSSDMSTLNEIGNIIIVSCISTISNLIKGSLNYKVPFVTSSVNNAFLDGLKKQIYQYGSCIAIQNVIKVMNTEIEGYFFILLSIKDIEVIYANANFIEN